MDKILEKFEKMAFSKFALSQILNNNRLFILCRALIQYSNVLRFFEKVYFHKI